MGLAPDIGFGCFALVVEGVEILFEACVGRDAGVDRASQPRFAACGHHAARVSVRRSPSWRGFLARLGLALPRRLPARPEAEEAMAVPTRPGDGFGDHRQAAKGGPVPGEAVIEDGHPFQPAAPFPRENRAGPQIDALARGGEPVGEGRGSTCSPRSPEPSLRSRAGSRSPKAEACRRYAITRARSHDGKWAGGDPPR